MRSIFAAALLLLSMNIHAFLPAAEVRPETGKVRWGRDLDAAKVTARMSGKPIMLLFQEVPGCQGCRQYGAEVLSHPEIVRAAENDFIPVLVFNNQPGRDAEILRQFNEPAWNFQVVRYLNANGQDLIPREENIWTVQATASRMARVLHKLNRPIAPTLAKLAGIVPAANPQPATLTAAFAMYCFWDGEAKFSTVRGVTETEAAFIDGREVVRLSFDPSVVTWAELVRRAEAFDCAHHIYAPTIGLAKATRSRFGVSVFDPAKCRRAPESDQKRYRKSQTSAARPRAFALESFDCLEVSDRIRPCSQRA